MNRMRLERAGSNKLTGAQHYANGYHTSIVVLIINYTFDMLVASNLSLQTIIINISYYLSLKQYIQYHSGTLLNYCHAARLRICFASWGLFHLAI